MPSVKTRQQLASAYGIDRKTLYLWLKNANLEIKRGLLMPCDLKKIFEAFGKPNEAIEGNSDLIDK